MILIHLLLLLLACVGLTYTIVQTEIMDIIGLRPLWEKSTFFKKLFNCAFCTGTWVGGPIYGVLCLSLLYFQLYWIFYVITLPFASATLSFIYERSVIMIDNINIILEKYIETKK